MSVSRPLPAEHVEPLTPEQQAAVDAWRANGQVDSAQVAALRKQARGEPLTEGERAILAAPGRKPASPGTP